ncbi:hypothetical protein [uncultured Vagococcus sp.]|uniref:hypothetical protein n=1 Tax=uncultured Vagococcus sp. TaxID=189676 RepID=UPI0028D4D518|nr:hypothetical protein [uncultured Vagococcus sp.]
MFKKSVYYLAVSSLFILCSFPTYGLAAVTQGNIQYYETTETESTSTSESSTVPAQPSQSVAEQVPKQTKQPLLQTNETTDYLLTLIGVGVITVACYILKTGGK